MKEAVHQRGADTQDPRLTGFACLVTEVLQGAIHVVKRLTDISISPIAWIG